MTIILEILALILTISLLVAVHELGHFWVARLCGIKVLRFSIGFGKPVWSRRAGPDQTEYCIGALPLGGYVKMLDDREGEVVPEDQRRSFNAQPVWQRIAVLLAGPAFNFLFAIAAYWLLFVGGTNVTRPVVGYVEPGSPAAAAGLQFGDVIAAVGDRQIRSWQGSGLQVLVDELVDDARLPLTLERGDGQRIETELRVDRDTARLAEPGKLFDGLGFRPWAARPLVGGFADDSPGRIAGLEIGDRIEAVDGEPVTTFVEMATMIRARPDQTVTLDVLRGERRISVEVRTDAVVDGSQRIGRIGVSEAEVRPDNLYAEYKLGMLAAIPAAIHRTWELSGFTLGMFGRMITGSVSTSNISGPISIAEYARFSLLRGFGEFIGFLAMVSVSLGLLNLMPIPMLDGGQIVFQSVEGITGKPLNEKWQLAGQQIGIVMLLGVMSLAFYNDIARLVGRILT